MLVMRDILLTFQFVFIVVRANFTQIDLNGCKANCESSVGQGNEKGTFLCDTECQIKQCKIGCSLARDAVFSTCPYVCQNASSGVNRGIFEGPSCVRGCNAALQRYGARVQRSLQALPAPQLIRGTERYSTVSLQWDAGVIENVKYILKLKVQTGPWLIHNASKFNHRERTITVSNLLPYTMYTFKVSAMITGIFFVDSADSLPIMTRAHGAPSDAPTISSVSTPSPSVIAVSWMPPEVTNGQLLSYKLSLEPLARRSLHPKPEPVFKDISANLTSWTFGQLEPALNYTFTVSACNAEGEGPGDATNITTPKADNLSDPPYLILGADNMVLKYNLLHLLSRPDQVHHSPNESVLIKGVGIHFEKQLIFVSRSDGLICMISLLDDETITDKYPVIRTPSALTVDWLNDALYVIDGTRIMKCSISGDDCIIAVNPGADNLTDVKVDPINGFLFFVRTGVASGLFRLDLLDVGLPEQRSLKQIVRSNVLSALAIDYENIRLYFPNETKNTMLATFLDGTQVNNIRPNVMLPEFNRVLSMVQFNGLFYWTNGTQVLHESFDPNLHKYRHDKMLFFEHHYRGFNMYHSTAQPKPVPPTPPGGLQVLFSDSKAYVSWKMPTKLQYQGNGAYNSWSYEVVVKDQINSHFIIQRQTNSTSCDISNLMPDTPYMVTVRAVSDVRNGPWCAKFKGRTLKKEAAPPSVLIAGERKITLVSLDGQKKDTILSFNVFDDLVTDLTWHNDTVVWTGRIMPACSYNITSGVRKRLNHINKAATLAYDWLGKMVYWSSPKTSLVIQRSPLDGNTVDAVYESPALNLAIDSVAGRLYWSTMFTVEVAFLNGEDHMEYLSIPYIVEKHVISLSLDTDHHNVYWVTRGIDHHDLYMAAMLDYGRIDEPSTARFVGVIKNNIGSILGYYSDRLLWIGAMGSLMMGNLQANHTAILVPSAVDTFMLSTRRNPDHDGLVVCPVAIPDDQLHIVGPWSNFNLTWKSSSEVNHGKVYYELQMEHGKISRKLVTKDNWHSVTDLSPYTKIHLSLRPYTYWSYGPLTEVITYSPMSEPSQPLMPRVYITQRKDATTARHSLAADFRWLTPEFTNGIMSRHVVYHRLLHSRTWTTAEVAATARHFILENLKPNTSYVFQVQSCTTAGCGAKSERVSALTDAVNPVPKLLIATESSITLAEVDGTINSSVVMAAVSPVAMTYLADSNKMYWTDSTQQLIEADYSKETKLLQLNASLVVDLCMDWISRTVYIASQEYDTESSSILAYNVDQKSNTVVLTRDHKVQNIVVDPYTSMIYWTESMSTGHVCIWKSFLNGSNASQLLDVDDDPQRDERSIGKRCSCPPMPNVAAPIAMDYSTMGKTEIYFVDSTTKTIWATDQEGCQCREVYKDTQMSQGLPPEMLSVDHQRVYWSSQADGGFYSINKATGKHLVDFPIDDIRDIVAFGSHLQPLPGPECLDPSPYSGTPKLILASNTTLTVQLDDVFRAPECDGISQSAPKYSVYYIKLTTGESTTPCDAANARCHVTESYDRFVILENLDPHSEYLIQAAVSNFYTEYLAEALGKSVIYKTKPGVPSPVESLTAVTTGADNVRLQWLPPSDLNGPEDDITYKVMWTTINKTLRNGPQEILAKKNRRGFYQAPVTGLQGDQQYSFKVRAYDESEFWYSESVAAAAHTFMKPGPLRFVNATNSSILIVWQSNCDNSVIRNSFRYAPANIEPMEWRFGALSMTTNCSDFYGRFIDLQAAQEYAFFLVVVYRGTSKPVKEETFIFRTLSGHPNMPDAPVVRQRGSVFEVIWAEPNDNGEPITEYMLEHRLFDKENWSSTYNGSDTHWMVDEDTLQPGQQHWLRVKALNSHGWSPYSQNVSFILPPVVTNNNEDVTVAVAIGLSFLLIVVVLILITMWIVYKRRLAENKRKATQFIAVARSPDVELAILRELPHTAVQQSNTLYLVNIIPTDDDIAALPHCRRDQLMLTKFLGSGAFGEVFEGLARNILGEDSGKTKVAVKTLQKSASVVEKEEFLKEALLMSNFKHEHILSLLGVCLDNDPQFIILELMEGGDLLSYVRSCRPGTLTSARLSMPDLVKICVHVSRGCQYLEELHFVHRDLAARNCLVSCKDPSEMIVKIGDFGLARDIYKNDYYRKEGEGLLPVRWMSPESLVDGVFTTPSDIWAFGVLMWEVITLGQQPYPARNNIEVLHYVRSGGQLDRPDNCPDDLYHLMSKCWSYMSEDRPTFSYLLLQLEQFQAKCQDNVELHSVPAWRGVHTEAEVRRRATPSPGEPEDQGHRPTRLSRNHPEGTADGFNRRNPIATPKPTWTSSNGDDDDVFMPDEMAPDETSVHAKLMENLASESPGPNTDYMHPRSGDMPPYLELFGDSPPASPSKRLLDAEDRTHCPEDLNRCPIPPPRVPSESDSHDGISIRRKASKGSRISRSSGSSDRSNHGLNYVDIEAVENTDSLLDNVEDVEYNGNHSNHFDLAQTANPAVTYAAISHNSSEGKQEPYYVLANPANPDMYRHPNRVAAIPLTRVPITTFNPRERDIPQTQGQAPNHLMRDPAIPPTQGQAPNHLMRDPAIPPTQGQAPNHLMQEPVTSWVNNNNNPKALSYNRPNATSENVRILDYVNSPRSKSQVYPINNFGIVHKSSLV